jgi:hypothetical protein
MMLKGIIKSKYKTLEELPKKSVITIPGDPANGGRVSRIKKWFTMQVSSTKCNEVWLPFFKTYN